ncbi:MAG: nucleotide-binding protein [Methanothrix sp.]|jgi:predicted nucleotide-binding protein|nr:nucleotide-binding protein [Methanothrix sp.]
MQENIAIRIFKATKDKMYGSEYPVDIVKYYNDAVKLVEDYIGKEDDHYTNISKGSFYSYETQREIVLAELESIIMELEDKQSKKPITGQINASERKAAPLDAYFLATPTRVICGNNSKEIKKVFIVHGHDGEMKQEAANVLLRLKLVPVILHEQPDEGKTIIEKFETHSDVDFAIILLSPDDFAYPKGASPSEGMHRARQNVIMELGYFIAKLGRNRVVALYRQNDNFEIPSDYLGVLYKPYVGDWKYKLVDEMKKIDPTIDKNLL